MHTIAYKIARYTICGVVTQLSKHHKFAITTSPRPAKQQPMRSADSPLYAGLYSVIWCRIVCCVVLCVCDVFIVQSRTICTIRARACDVQHTARAAVFTHRQNAILPVLDAKSGFRSTLASRKTCRAARISHACMQRNRGEDKGSQRREREMLIIRSMDQSISSRTHGDTDVYFT